MPFGVAQDVLGVIFDVMAKDKLILLTVVDKVAVHPLLPVTVTI